MELIIIFVIVIPVVILLVMRRAMRGDSPSHTNHSNFQEGTSGLNRSGGFWWLWGSGSAMHTSSGSDSDYQETGYDSGSRKSSDQSFDLNYDHSPGESATDSYSGDCSDSGGSGDCSDSGGGGDCGGGD